MWPRYRRNASLEIVKSCNSLFVPAVNDENLKVKREDFDQEEEVEETISTTTKRHETSPAPEAGAPFGFPWSVIRIAFGLA